MKGARWRRLGGVLIALALGATSCSVPVDRTTITPVSASDADASTETAQPVEAEFADGGFATAVDTRWPEVVRPYVDIVQDSRGEEFEIIAGVRFEDQAALQAEFDAGRSTLADVPPDVLVTIERVDDMHRALGLANQDFGILDAGDEVVSDIAAFYDWFSGEVVFPSPGGVAPDEIAIVDRAVLVHEIAHALQIHQRLGWSRRVEDPALSLAMLEGEAEWLSDRYIESLSDDEFAAWVAALPEPPPRPDAPEILAAKFFSSYVLGSRFFHARFAVGGLDGVNEVFSDNGLVSSQMLLDPWLFDGTPADITTFNYDIPAPRDPDIPESQHINMRNEFPMSAVDWYFVLAGAVPARSAVDAARVINSFTLPMGWINSQDQFCFTIWLTADDGQFDVVHTALQTWASQLTANRWIATRDETLKVSGCDPGPGNGPPVQQGASDALNTIATIIDTELWGINRDLDRRVGYCVGWDFLGALEADPDLDIPAWFDALDPANLTSDC